MVGPGLRLSAHGILKTLNCFRASFLQNGAAIVEIAWPTRGWYYFYADKGMFLIDLKQNRLNAYLGKWSVQVYATEAIYLE